MVTTNDKAPPRWNSEHYRDPTADLAMQSVEADEARIKRVVRFIKDFLDMMGFDLLARIEIRDRRTGKEYK